MHTSFFRRLQELKRDGEAAAAEAAKARSLAAQAAVQAAAEADVTATVRAAEAAAAVAAEVAAREALQRAHEDALRAAAEDVDDEVECLKAGYASHMCSSISSTCPLPLIFMKQERTQTQLDLKSFSGNKPAGGELLQYSNNHLVLEITFPWICQHAGPALDWLIARCGLNTVPRFEAQLAAARTAAEALHGDNGVLRHRAAAAEGAAAAARRETLAVGVQRDELLKVRITSPPPTTTATPPPLPPSLRAWDYGYRERHNSGCAPMRATDQRTFNADFATIAILKAGQV